MHKGYIYRISDRRASNPNHFLPDLCYIGQTYQSIEDRWRQHKHEATNYDPSSNSRPSRAAKLHEAMRVLGLENMRIDCLKEVICASEQELIDELDRLESDFIKQFNSIEAGWNKVKAPRKRKARGNGLNLAEAARKADVPYTSLLNRVNVHGEAAEDAIRHLQNLTQTVYLYKRQQYKDIAEIAGSDVIKRFGLQRKTIEQRIRKGRAEGRLKEELDLANSLVSVYLDDAVFKPSRKRHSLKLSLPDGIELQGSIKSIFDELVSMNAASKYELPVPDKYTTIQARLARKSANWTVEQAFGFDVPPVFNSVKSLVSESGYKWVPERPVNDEGSPVVLHETREIFISQEAFCEEFLLSKYQVSDRISDGMGGDEILRHYELRASAM